MAWRYRRTIQFPFGIRVNFSKSGIGWSWGFRGFRVGGDSKGRITRTVSIPGTGIYNRVVIPRATEARQENGGANPYVSSADGVSRS
jgi:hypothetical protein